MNLHIIQSAVDAVPFRPFTIFLTDQRQFRISYPNYIWVTPFGIVGVIAGPALHLVDIAHILSITIEEGGK